MSKFFVSCATGGFAVFLAVAALLLSACEPKRDASKSNIFVALHEWGENLAASRNVFLAYDAQAKALLAQMTLDEKIGQMMQPDQGALKSPDDIEKYGLGSLLSGGGSGPRDRSKYNLEGWTDMVDGYQKHALKTRLAIPLLYGIDAVHGNNNIPGATIFPHNIGLGCTGDCDLVFNIERITAEEVRATGINWVFAPCVTCPQDIRWGRTYEGFSSDPRIVERFAISAVQGFQGIKYEHSDELANLADPLSVAACAKHFVGDGGTSYGSAAGRLGLCLDQGDTRVDEQTLRTIHLPGFRTTVDAGVATIMPSYSSWNGIKCSANKYLLTDVLKGELGFQGFLISDYNAVDQISPDYATCVATSINAGMDMVMMTNKYPLFFDTLKQLVADGKVPLSRIDDAVVRILRVKFALGLMDKKRSPLADRALQKSFGSPEHRAVARQAVRESLVLLKNEHQTLPLKKTAAHIVLAGRGADSLGMQCGGWTIDWQGKMNHVIPGGTSILTAVKNAVSKDAVVSYSADGTGAAGVDFAIAVIGETPYAEGAGDRVDLSLAQSEHDVVANLKKAGVPVVVIVLSGRPVLLGDILDNADALVAAWLPGSEGAGIADVLFGDAKPVGKLSFNWPNSMAGFVGGAGAGDKNAELQFKLGFGLSYGK